ncbi:hypothetical protein HYN59_14760 [Flavobacterium album]|uniref:DUF3551 domain-containing protein n=1 Tax=Flavobacterium album TaxID=2175091 RepID=A0A2S1R174_9FLAO|nr:DUF6520 family protein [Flavobacterium album]AWH86291.1 hypothetical protein HYN59_14760 [Flavobacterium album]
MNKKMFSIVLPAAVLAIGVLSAFGTQAKSSDKGALANEPGWYHTSPNELCKSETDCNIVQGDVCTVNMIPGAQQLYRRTALRSCEFPLYRPQ